MSGLRLVKSQKRVFGWSGIELCLNTSKKLETLLAGCRHPRAKGMFEMPKKKETRSFKDPHPTDSFKKKHEYRTIICSWAKGDVEIHILKFPPATDVTTFYIIGRLDPEEDYTPFQSKPAIEFIPTYAKYLELIKKLDAKYYANGTIKKESS